MNNYKFFSICDWLKILLVVREIQYYTYHFNMTDYIQTHF